MRTAASFTVGLSTSVLEPRTASDGIDGIGVYTLALERGLSRLGVATKRVGANARRGVRLACPENAEVAFSIPLSIGIGMASLARTRMPFTDRVESEIDLYHATDYRIPRLRRTPVVATLYDAIPLAHPEWAGLRWQRTKNWVLREAAQAADRVIAISQAAVAELVEHYKLPESRIRVIPLGVDEVWFETPPPEVLSATLRRFGLRPGYFLFVGTLQPRKNVAALIDAYDRLPASVRDAHQLVIVGRYGWSVPELRKELLVRRAQSECMWLDYVDWQALRALYAAALALVFPSLAEGFGLPVLEAMAAGVPVIASDLPVLREVAGTTATLVPPRDADALIEAMRLAALAPVDRALAATRRAHARTMDWLTCARRTVGVYGELVNGVYPTVQFVAKPSVIGVDRLG